MKNALMALVAATIVPLAVGAETINYVGSSTVGKFMSDAKGAYSGASLKLDTVPESSGGEQCAARKSCDVGGVAREVNQKFLDKGVVKTLIGKDAIAVVVHSENPLGGLSADQLKAVFTGKVTNWKELGGADMPIKPYIVKKGSATRKVFREVVLGSDAYAGTKVVTPDAKIVTTVARDKGAIGQISFAFLKGKDGVKPLHVGCQLATVENPSYPITRPLYLVTNGAPAGEVKAFIDWALTSEGQSVVKTRFVGAK